ncbi:DUF5994 family protein [Amycolatopsis sp. FDAARGOS 1241]|uniref:DUF5994 family protein n=1 Tax=Amycolatopsis sp. FDAARGOS 1241 TaxID=2778070 RepID=UPI00194EFC5A|nr:DUF5994 family protein [Amycolatopsis sp. FDAARGOS 1241]QRP47918.1 hypothetical protein I6J71_08465 [Amycolatopsis sp. FDAARGOS 1241]
MAGDSPRLRGPATTDESRVRLKPPHSVAGFVDGAWWPRSADLTAEAPGLAAALADRIGPVWRVAFASSAWTAATTKLIHRGRVVRLEGFRSQDPHVVHVTGSLMRRVTLLVVPPRTAPAIAERALSTASERNDSTLPETILDGGIVTGPPAESDVQRWESDGGSAGHRLPATVPRP